MKEKDIVEVLGRLKGEADAPAHRTALRRALLSQPQSMNSFAALQHFIKASMIKKYFIPLAVITLVVVGAAAFNPTDPSVAQAQEQAQRSWARAVQISPEMRAELEAKMKADMLETLKEAMAAPDLRILTREEYEKEAPFTFSTGPGPAFAASLATGTIKEAHTVAFSRVEGVAGEAGEVKNGDVTFTVSASAIAPESVRSAAIHGTAVMSAGMVTASATNSFSEPVKYLSYTDKEGHKTVLGLDKNDTPVFKFSTLNAGDVMHFEDGSIGIQGKAVKMINIQSAELAE